MNSDVHIVIHRSGERGRGEHGWLNTRHSFSFGQWYDPNRMGFGALRVLNDDVIAPHSGFGTHPHKNMEIITIVTKGELTHRDSMGTTGHVNERKAQVMSAGSGVLHSEYNEGQDSVSLFQIWITPNVADIAPRYQEHSFVDMEEGEQLLVAPYGSQSGVLEIHQDAYISKIMLNTEVGTRYALKDASHGVYVFVVEGTLEVEGHTLEKGDAIGVVGVSGITLLAHREAQILAIEVPMR